MFSSDARLFILLIALTLPELRHQTSNGDVTSWANTLEGRLSRSCVYGFGVFGLYSVYDEAKRDRLWRMHCSRISPNIPDECKWTYRFINHFGQPSVNYTCAENFYVAGLYSDYDPRTSDRKWRVECCNSTDVTFNTCIDTDKVNSLNGTLEFRLPPHFALHGLRGSYDAAAQDRQWWFRICEIARRRPNGPNRRRPGRRRPNRPRNSREDGD